MPHLVTRLVPLFEGDKVYQLGHALAVLVRHALQPGLETSCVNVSELDNKRSIIVVRRDRWNYDRTLCCVSKASHLAMELVPVPCLGLHLS